ncbi:MAG: ArnT family glycosyltransferase [Acidimicrobiales bacterium]
MTRDLMQASSGTLGETDSSTGGRDTGKPVRRAGRLRHSWQWCSEHRVGIVVLLGLLLVNGFAQGHNMYRSPQLVNDDEGTYVAQAFAVLHFHALTPYTYWYDHPPLGWILVAGYLFFTGAIHHAPTAVDAGRQSMLFFGELSVAFLYSLARRLGLARWTSALTVLIFALSPLALSYHRQVLLDNVATTLLIASFVLALSPRRRLLAQGASGLCFGASVLSKETFLLFLPAFAWQLWRAADKRTRAFVMATASGLFGLSLSMYVLYAALKGELLPGKGHVSLVGAIEWQLAQRPSSGSVFQAGSGAHSTVTGWLSQDPWLLGVGLVMLPVIFARRSLRAVGLAYAFTALAILRPGYLPLLYIIGLLPFAALAVGGGVDTLWRWRPAIDTSRFWWRARRLRPYGLETAHLQGSISLRLLGPLTAAVLMVVAVAGAAPAWARADHSLLTSNADGTYVEAEHWVESHVPRYDRILVDDDAWVDLVRAGFPPNQVVWFYKLGTDPEVDARFPQGWRDFQYIIAAHTIKYVHVSTTLWTIQALAHSKTVASFGGDGPWSVQVMRVDEARPVVGPGRSRAG